MAELKIISLRKEYEKGRPAVEDFTLEAADGELIAIVGPSGCGKSTTLRMIAGLETVTSGKIILDGAELNDVETRDRDIAMVFQNYALYENMTVFGNIAFPLKVRKVNKEEIAEKVKAISEILKIRHLLDRRPKTLSGGEKQRVAMGRALVRKPKLFLMDEPLSNLDAKLKAELREEIRRIQKEIGTTTVYVTHDQTEAMSIADRVVVMSEGRIRQTGTPEEIYMNPADPFVAEFFGQPAMNIWKDENKTYGIRPTDIEVFREAREKGFRVKITEQYYSGGRWEIKVEREGLRLTVYSDKKIDKEEFLWIHFPEDKLHCWEKRGKAER